MDGTAAALRIEKECFSRDGESFLEIATGLPYSRGGLP